MCLLTWLLLGLWNKTYCNDVKDIYYYKKLCDTNKNSQWHLISMIGHGMFTLKEVNVTGNLGSILKLGIRILAQVRFEPRNERVKMWKHRILNFNFIMLGICCSIPKSDFEGLQLFKWKRLRCWVTSSIARVLILQWCHLLVGNRCPKCSHWWVKIWDLNKFI